MSNVNYIASAGTGKTYSLISEVLNKIKDENISLRNMLILTFTEKAASELKEKLSLRIREILNNPNESIENKKKLHREILFIDSGYIGTFHSIFLRLLKKYPNISKIDGSFEIISNNLEDFLSTVFEKWIEENYQEDKQNWEEIIKYFEGKPWNVKNIFINLYKNKLKLKNNLKNINLQEQKNEILKKVSDLEKIVNELISKYKEPLIQIEEKYQGKFFNYSPIYIKSVLENKNYAALPSLNTKSIFKKPKNPTQEENEFYNQNIKPLKKDENFTTIEDNLLNITSQLKNEVLDYNANFLLKKFYEFLNYVDRLKEENKIIDFEDILERMLNLVENKKIAESIKKSFKYIFIDEFQDTDYIQTNIIQKISDNNIYVFGDPKQCIYTWRNANLKVYYKFLENNKFEDKALDTNYRSSPLLVEFFNELVTYENFLKSIENKFKRPIKANSNSNNSSYVKLIKLETDSKEKKDIINNEAEYTAYLINELSKKGIDFKDIMILFRKNKDLKIFKDIFLKQNIPVISTANNNLFEQEEIKAILNILKIIEFPKRKLTFLKVLKSPLVYILDYELYEKKDQLSINKLDFENIKLLEKLSENRLNLPIEEIIDTILKETDIMQVVSMLPEGEKKVENLNKLKILAKKKSLEGFSLRDFILYAETSYEPEADLNTENAVKLFTMHKSKGLESKVVIIPLISVEPSNSIKLEDGIYEYNKNVYLYYTKNKVKNKEIENIKDKLKEEITDELERLFYVAVTRAKEKLIIIQSDHKNTRTKGYYPEKLNGLFKTFPKFNKEKEKFENIKIEPLKQKEKNIDNIEEKLKEIEEIEKKREEKYTQAINQKRLTSVSQLMEEDYKSELITYDLNKDRTENLSLYIGILVHEVLEKLDFKNFNLETVNKLIQEKKNFIPEVLREKVVKESLEILKKFENSQLHKELKNADILFRELPFTLYENGIYIEGRLDLIYQKDNKITVMDYKTNRYETQEKKEKIVKSYQKQKEYYLKAVKKIYPDKDVNFKLGLLWKGEVV